jgi:PAS domain S-box-containing protein
MRDSLKELLNRPFARYISAIIAIALIFLLREALCLIVGPDFPEYLLFYPTVLAVALLAGFWPAILSGVEAAFFVALWILSWNGPSASTNTSNVVGLGLFECVCVFLCMIAELYRRSRQKAAAYDKEQALRESQEQLRRQAELLKLSFDAIIVRRMDGFIESWNRGAEELYGYPEREALGSAIHELLGVEDITPRAEYEALLRESGQWEGELRHRTREGREVIVSSRQHMGRGHDGKERVLEIDRDITDRKRAQEELQRAHDELEEKVLQRTSDLQRANRMLRMVSACDRALVDISDESELMHVICQIIQDEGGYPLVWVGLTEGNGEKSIRCMASAGDRGGFLDGLRSKNGALAAGPTGESIHSGLPAVRADLARIAVGEPWKEDTLRIGFRSMAALPLMSAEKTAFGALVIYSDRIAAFGESQITLLEELADDLAFGIMSLRAKAERNQAQRALEMKASQLQVLAGELVRTEQRERRRIAQLLHDQLQQLLAAALYSLASLRTAQKTVKFQNALQKLGGLLRECITMSRSLTSELSHPAFSEPDLREALEWLAAWMKEKHGLEVDVETEEEVVVEAEETRIMLLQAVRELLFNVVKHAGVKNARVRLSLAAEGQVLISVRDEGAGFDVSKIGAHGGSSGIGLSSLRERLALAGGGMEMESSPGRGSRLTLWVPAPRTEAGTERTTRPMRRRSRKPPAAGTAEHSAPAIGGKIRVLLVDDHKVVRNGLALQLREHSDIEIVGEASDGRTAVKLARKLRPDVVTMDVGMPGMNGIEAARIIHAELPSTGIIGLSMFEEATQAAAMRAAGAAGYISKSESFDRLLAAIRSCSGKARVGRKRPARKN